MKEATGEANMTIVTVIIIAAVVAIATPLIINMMRTTDTKTQCFNNGQNYDAATNRCVPWTNNQ